MTPKEKAKELCDLYWNYADTWKKASVLAILCVDEIIKANPTNWDDGPESQIPYWQQVKEELQKM